MFNKLRELSNGELNISNLFPDHHATYEERR